MFWPRSCRALERPPSRIMPSSSRGGGGVSPRYVDEPPLPTTCTSWGAAVALHTVGKLWQEGRHPRDVASAASPRTRSQLPDASASAGVSQEPPTQPTFGSARYSAAFDAEMPPVGQNRTCGTGDAIDERNDTPPTAAAGNSFSSV